MSNQLILVGRVVNEIILKESDGERKSCTIKLAIPRSFKNRNGEYDTDFIDVVVLENIAQSTSEYVKKGDVIGIKGRVQELEGEPLRIIAEKVTFLTSRAKGE